MALFWCPDLHSLLNNMTYYDVMIFSIAEIISANNSCLDIIILMRFLPLWGTGIAINTGCELFDPDHSWDQ